MPTVSSKSALVAPQRIATANPCVISPACLAVDRSRDERHEAARRRSVEEEAVRDVLPRAACTTLDLKRGGSAMAAACQENVCGTFVAQSAQEVRALI